MLQAGDRFIISFKKEGKKELSKIYERNAEICEYALRERSVGRGRGRDRVGERGKGNGRGDGWGFKMV